MRWRTALENTCFWNQSWDESVWETSICSCMKVTICHLQLFFFSWSIGLRSAYIWLLLSTRPARLCAGLPALHPQGFCLRHKVGSLILIICSCRGSWRLCSYGQVTLLSPDISATYRDPIRHWESTAPHSIGTRVTSLLHFSICWTPEMTCK